MTEHRRSEDDRLLRMENAISDINHSVTDIQVKLNNGLSSRSIETVATVSHVKDKQAKLELQLTEHIAESNLVLDNISVIKDAISEINKSQKCWISMFHTGMLALLTLLIMTIGWTVYNIDLIQRLISHLFSIMGI